jgi:hypothetical protein
MHDNDNTHELKVLMLDTATGFYRMRRYRVGDFFFFHVGITGEGDHFQPVQQGPGNQIDGVGRGDEHDVGEIERRVQRIKDKGKENCRSDGKTFNIYRLYAICEALDKGTFVSTSWSGLSSSYRDRGGNG